MTSPENACVPESSATVAAEPSPRVIELPTLTVERVPLRIAVLRLWKPHAEHFTALSEVFGFAWPSVANRVAGTECRALWLAPDTWAIVGPLESLTRDRAARALGERLHHVSEVSEGRAVFSVRGPLARSVLSKGCSLDLHPRQLAEGQCAQSLLAQVPVLIEPLAVNEPHALDYRLYVDISYAGYLRAWFIDASLEYS
jgi:heterotetrameric sarcosine oxidase gamma subunit